MDAAVEMAETDLHTLSTTPLKPVPLDLVFRFQWVRYSRRA